jgi:hypothetical protein
MVLDLMAEQLLKRSILRLVGLDLGVMRDEVGVRVWHLIEDCVRAGPVWLSFFTPFNNWTLKFSRDCFE